MVTEHETILTGIFKKWCKCSLSIWQETFQRKLVHSFLVTCKYAILILPHFLSDIFCMTNYYYNIASAQKSQNLFSSINNKF